MVELLERRRNMHMMLPICLEVEQGTRGLKIVISSSAPSGESYARYLPCMHRDVSKGPPHQ